METQQTIVALQNADANNAEEIAALEANLNATIEALKNDVAQNANNITANMEVINNELAAITEAIEALVAADADITEELDLLNEALESLIVSFNTEIEVLNEDIADNVLSLNELQFDINVVVADLREEIMAAQSAAQAYADAHDEVGSFDASNLQTQIDTVSTNLGTVETTVGTIQTTLERLEGIDDAIAALQTDTSDADALTTLAADLRTEIQTAAQSAVVSATYDDSGVRTLITDLQTYVNNNEAAWSAQTTDTTLDAAAITTEIAEAISGIVFPAGYEDTAVQQLITDLQADLAQLSIDAGVTNAFGWPVALAEQLANAFTDNGDGTYSGPNGLVIDMTNNQQIRINRDDLATHEVFDNFDDLEDFLDDNPHPDSLLAFTNPNDINVVRNQPYSIQLVNFDGTENVRIVRLSDNRAFNPNNSKSCYWKIYI